MATESFTDTTGTTLFAHNASWKAANALSTDFVIDTNALRTPYSRNLELAAYYDGTYADNQYATATLTQAGASNLYMGVAVRATGGNYYFFYASSGYWALLKSVSYSITLLAESFTTVSSGAVLYLEAIGSTITAKINGSQVASVTDTSITSGKPGVSGKGTGASGTYTLLDDWSGGEIPKPAQARFRWRKDDGSETTATWASSENNNVVAPLG